MRTDEKTEDSGDGQSKDSKWIGQETRQDQTYQDWQSRAKENGNSG
jgi:hypothetical protein